MGDVWFEVRDVEWWWGGVDIRVWVVMYEERRVYGVERVYGFGDGDKWWLGVVGKGEGGV